MKLNKITLSIITLSTTALRAPIFSISLKTCHSVYNVIEQTIDFYCYAECCAEFLYAEFLYARFLRVEFLRVEFLYTEFLYAKYGGASKLACSSVLITSTDLPNI